MTRAQGPNASCAAEFPAPASSTGIRLLRWTGATSAKPKDAPARIGCFPGFEENPRNSIDDSYGYHGRGPGTPSQQSDVPDAHSCEPSRPVINAAPESDCPADGRATTSWPVGASVLPAGYTRSPKPSLIIRGNVASSASSAIRHAIHAPMVWAGTVPAPRAIRLVVPLQTQNPGVDSIGRHQSAFASQRADLNGLAGTITKQAEREEAHNRETSSPQ